VDLQRFLEVRWSSGQNLDRRKLRAPELDFVFQSLPDEERDRVMGEEKPGGSRGGMASSPHRAKSLAKVRAFFFSGIPDDPEHLMLVTC